MLLSRSDSEDQTLLRRTRIGCLILLYPSPDFRTVWNILKEAHSNDWIIRCVSKYRTKPAIKLSVRCNIRRPAPIDCENIA